MATNERAYNRTQCSIPNVYRQAMESGESAYETMALKELGMKE